MDYGLVPTTIFTPSEYGTVGLSEEQAIQKYGEENLEVYIFEFTTLEMAAVHRIKVRSCYLIYICNQNIIVYYLLLHSLVYYVSKPID